MNEKSAREAGLEYTVWTEAFIDNDRSLAEGEKTGKIKLLLDKNEKPLGVQKTMEASAKNNQKFTYRDYLEWPDEERWELLDGEAYNMTPAPSRTHQKIILALANIFYNYLEDKSCEVYVAPFDVRLPEGRSIRDGQHHGGSTRPDGHLRSRQARC